MFSLTEKSSSRRENYSRVFVKTLFLIVFSLSHKLKAAIVEFAVILEFLASKHRIEWNSLRFTLVVKKALAEIFEKYS